MTQGSWEDVRAHGTKRLLPYFGELQMTRIGGAAVRDWRATVLEAVEAGAWAAKTINHARIALLGCVRMAIEDGLMAHNPVLDVRPLPVELAEHPYLRLAQINDYLDCCAPHYRPLAAMLIGTGARISEAIALRVDDVDLAAGTVRIHKQRVPGARRGVCRSRPVSPWKRTSTGRPAARCATRCYGACVSARRWISRNPQPAPVCARHQAQ